MRKIVIITGATGGLGQEFVRQICFAGEQDEIWAIGRNKEKLETLKALDERIRTIEADLAADVLPYMHGYTGMIRAERVEKRRFGTALRNGICRFRDGLPATSVSIQKSRRQNSL